MILWTIQHRTAHDEMLRTGVLRGDPAHIANYRTNAYAWMSDQMTKRIGNPPDGVSVPVWAWYQWEGKRKERVIRRFRHGWSEKGTPLVLLTLDVPDDQVLLSDFDYWHFVLNDVPITFSDDEDCSKEEKEKSWENIFDITRSFDGDIHNALSTQATLWEIKNEWVASAEYFISR